VHLRINHPSVISESIDDEVVIIALSTGTYYSLRSTAARAWDALVAGGSTEAVAADLATAFVTDDVAVGAEVDAFVARLVADGLVVEADDQPAHPTPTQPAAPMPAPATLLPWDPLVVETFTDMQELILLDPVHEVEPGHGWPVAIDTDPAG
jgi:hypothetical protein